MTSHIQIPGKERSNKMANPTPVAGGMKGLVGRRMTTTHVFLGEKIEITKLTVGEVQEIQEAAQRMEKLAADVEVAKAAAIEAGQEYVPQPGEDDAGLQILQTVIRASVPTAADLTDEDFLGFPMDELSKLSDAIMKFSGMGAANTVPK